MKSFRRKKNLYEICNKVTLFQCLSDLHCIFAIMFQKKINIRILELKSYTIEQRDFNLFCDEEDYISGNISDYNSKIRQ